MFPYSLTMKEGITYCHEHITIDLSGEKQNDDCFLDCFDETVAELKTLYNKGVKNIIDVTNVGMKPNPFYVAKVARETGLNILQSTGFYTERFLPSFVAEQTTLQLSQFMLKELTVGIADSNIKASLIAELGVSKDGFTSQEKKVFEAAVRVHQETGVCLSTHSTLGQFALGQVDFFKREGINLEKVCLGHLDLSNDITTLLKVLESGCYAGFDTIGKENYLADSNRIALLLEIEKRDLIDKVMLSMDITRKSAMKYRGGLGYSYLLDTFLPNCLEAGLSQKSMDKMLISNPFNFFGTER